MLELTSDELLLLSCAVRLGFMEVGIMSPDPDSIRMAVLGISVANTTSPFCTNSLMAKLAVSTKVIAEAERLERERRK